MRTQKKKTIGMRQRWLLYSAVIACVVGMVCVLLVTSIFSGNLYASRETDIFRYVDTADADFDERVNKSEGEYYDACVLYAQTCDTGVKLDLQFVDTTGIIIASSSGKLDGSAPATTEIAEAVSSRGVCKFIGKEKQ